MLTSKGNESCAEVRMDNSFTNILYKGPTACSVPKSWLPISIVWGAFATNKCLDSILDLGKQDVWGRTTGIWTLSDIWLILIIN